MAMMSFPSIVGEICSSGDELAAKVRKPYTITKRRERWTDEEHLKFLEALKLHGRAWRRIEEHIGTKTAVQIRSHAQKFFSKLVKGSSGRGVSTVESHDIEIPPPRPKRKPRHPYPRKAGGTQTTTKEGSTSPSGVSSPLSFSLGEKSSKSSGFAPYDARARSNGHETKMDSTTQMNESPLSLKLFGQTMFVANSENSVSSFKPTVSNNSQDTFQEFYYQKQNTVSAKAKTEYQTTLEEQLLSGRDSSSKTEKLPRHIPVHCVVDAMSAENGHETVKQCASITALANMGISYVGSTSSPSIIPWFQKHEGDTTVAEAVATATVAAASAWLSLCGIMPPLVDPSMFGTAIPSTNPLSACNAESMKEPTEEEVPNVAERVGFILQGSLSENYTCNSLNEVDDAQDHGENLSCQTEERDQVMKDRELTNERLSSCSNTPLSNARMVDPYLAANMEQNRDVCKHEFQSNEGRCASEEDSSKEEEDTVSNNGYAETHIEGQTAFRALFSQESSSWCCSVQSSVGGDLSSNVTNKDTFSENGKQNSSTGGVEIQPDLRASISCQDQVNASEIDLQRPNSPSSSGKKGIQKSTGNYCKGNKFITSSIGKSLSGVGFVPYQRCSMQANKNRLHPRSMNSSEDGLREGKRICSKQ